MEGLVSWSQAVARPLSTSAVARAAGCSVQQVRDLEQLGVIAAATRADNGYRQFDASHVRDLLAYRELAHAVGPVAARRVLREVRLRPRAQAVALVGELHARLGREREQAATARTALDSIRHEASSDAAPEPGDSMTITELAQALGVRASTLRFWEESGLVAPDRVETAAGSTRRYPVPAVREARITAALRAGGYGIPEVRAAIMAVRDLGDLTRSTAALDGRLDDIASRGLALLRAGSVLAEIIGDEASG